MPVVKATIHHVADMVGEKKDTQLLVASDGEETEPDNDLDPVGLKKAFRFAVWSSVIMVRRAALRDTRISDRIWQTLVFMILIPLPLFGASTVYSVAGFSAWVIIGILWTFCSAFAVVLYPLWESREALVMILKGMVKVSTCYCASSA